MGIQKVSFKEDYEELASLSLDYRKNLEKVYQLDKTLVYLKKLTPSEEWQIRTVTAQIDAVNNAKKSARESLRNTYESLNKLDTIRCKGKAILLDGTRSICPNYCFDEYCTEHLENPDLVIDYQIEPIFPIIFENFF